MIRLFLVGLLSFHYLLAAAQPIIQAANYFPVAGDTLLTVVDDEPAGVTVTSPGGNQVWNFSLLENDGLRTRVVRAANEGALFSQFPNTELLLPLGPNAEGYYNLAADRLELVGYAGQDPLGQGLNIVTRFSPANIERWSQVQFFDLHNSESALLIAFSTASIPGGIFDNLPIAPDSIRIRIATQRTDLADAWGVVQLPGNLQFSCVREKRTEYRDVRLDAKVGPLPWFDITDLLIQNSPLPGLGRDTTLRYFYWSNDAKEPVAIVSVDMADQSVVSIEYKANPLISSDEELSPATVGLVVFPNPTSSLVNIRVQDIEPGRYHCQLLDAAGRLQQQQIWEINSVDYTASMSVEGYPAGSYFCRLLDATGRLLLSRTVVVE
jgi:hypothetical protein